MIANYLKGKEFNDLLKFISSHNGYCPCTVGKDEDSKCMCKEFRDMADGICRCGLFIKKKDV